MFGRIQKFLGRVTTDIAVFLKENRLKRKVFDKMLNILLVAILELLIIPTIIFDYKNTKIEIATEDGGSVNSV